MNFLMMGTHSGHTMPRDEHEQEPRLHGVPLHKRASQKEGNGLGTWYAAGHWAPPDTPEMAFSVPSKLLHNDDEDEDEDGDEVRDHLLGGRWWVTMGQESAHAAKSSDEEAQEPLMSSAAASGTSGD